MKAERCVRYSLHTVQDKAAVRLPPHPAVAVAQLLDTRRSEAVAVDIERPTPPFWELRCCKALIFLGQNYLDIWITNFDCGQWQFRKPKNSREDYRGVPS